MCENKPLMYGVKTKLNWKITEVTADTEDSEVKRI